MTTQNSNKPQEQPEKVEATTSAQAATPELTTTKVTKQNSDTVKDNTKDMVDALQVVVFTLAGEEYAAPILDVQEIIPTGDITPLPNVASYIAGIINVRGTVATVINVRNRFNLIGGEENQKDKYIILTKINENLFGMMVNEVTEVMKISRSDIKGNDSILESKIHADFISNVAVVNERVILILDFKKILDENTLNELTEKK